MARRFALENFMAFAPDALTTVGGYPNDDYKGGELFRFGSMRGTANERHRVGNQNQSLA